MTPKHLQALAKMLPEKVQLRDNEVLGSHLAWKNSPPNHAISYTELDYPCRLVEDTMRNNQFNFVSYPKELFHIVTNRAWDGDMGYFMFDYANATPEQKIEAAAKVKGIEI